MNESCCVGCINIPAMRTKHRIRHNIQVLSIFYCDTIIIYEIYNSSDTHTHTHTRTHTHTHTQTHSHTYTQTFNILYIIKMLWTIANYINLSYMLSYINLSYMWHLQIYIYTYIYIRHTNFLMLLNSKPLYHIYQPVCYIL